MKQSYAVLYKPTTTTRSEDNSSASLEELQETISSKLEILEAVDEEEAAVTARSDSVEAMAPLMETTLVEPMMASSSGPGEPWGIEAVGADKCKQNGAGVTVAVLDTGIDAAHPCFSGLTIEQHDFTGTGDGDRRGHGTHCAGVIFGREVQGQRVGVAPGVTRAYVGKVLDDKGRGSTQMIFDGMKWALDKKADIISMSLGIDFPGQVRRYVDNGMPVEMATSRGLDDFRRTTNFFSALMRLADAGGGYGQVSLIVAASGNDSRRDRDPSHIIYTSVPAVVADISVGALRNKNGVLSIAPFSNARPTLAAPGVDILSAWPGGGLCKLSGTSMACPHVSGVAALWLQYLRENGQQATRAVLSSHLIARSRRDFFGAGANSLDIGAGLVRAPGDS